MSRTGKTSCGFTFVEVMVTLVILSSGIVLIYKTFFLCADYLSRLSFRVQASELVDAKIADLSRLVKENSGLNFSQGPSTISQELNHRSVDFTYNIDIHLLSGFEDVWQMDVGVSWPESGHPARLSRSAIVSL